MFFFEVEQNLKCPGESSIIWREFSRIVYFFLPQKTHNVLLVNYYKKLSDQFKPVLLLISLTSGDSLRDFYYFPQNTIQTPFYKTLQLLDKKLSKEDTLSGGLLRY